jgi:hypothetical protein
MRYAFVNGEMREAERGLAGECRGCGKPMLARCGRVRIKHWAHKGKITCDAWLKDKTEWHINWQDHFPKPWQEFRFVAENGEMHIADVKTIKEWVIEFQHSPLAHEERQARNDFYKKLVWVVDGMTRKRDKSKFFDSLREVASVANQQSPVRRIFKVLWDDCALLRDWSECSSPVFFDFGKEELMLWCLLPKSSDGGAYVLEFLRAGFIAFHRNEVVEKDFFTDLMENFGNTVAELSLRSRAPKIVHVVRRPRYRYPRRHFRF